MPAAQSVTLSAPRARIMTRSKRMPISNQNSTRFHNGREGRTGRIIGSDVALSGFNGTCSSWSSRENAAVFRILLGEGFEEDRAARKEGTVETKRVNGGADQRERRGTGERSTSIADGDEEGRVMA